MYEWHDAKNTSNQEKHHLDFEDAVGVFEDDGRMEWNSNRGIEQRYVTVGALFSPCREEVIITVVYIVRDKVKRIISARRASKNERKKYYSSQSLWTWKN